MGLTSYGTLQWTQAIAVRKVVGDWAGHNVTPLTKDFVKLVVWSFAIDAPPSCILMHARLNGSAYRNRLLLVDIPRGGKHYFNYSNSHN
jgi:putative ABC transport system permease protein